jgi:hypothetical protein
MIKKVLYQNEYESPIFYGYKSEHKVKSYVKVTMAFDFREGLRFCVSVPNASRCYRNLIKAFLNILEHESIGMAKYNRLKDDVRNKDLVNKLL